MSVRKSSVKREKPKHFKKTVIKLISYLKPHLLPMIFVILFSVASVVLVIFATLTLRELTNVINDAALLGMESPLPMTDFLDLKLIGKLCLILAAFYGCNIVFSYVQAFIMAGINQKMARRFRSQILGKINRLPLSYYDKTPYGDTLSRITNDVDTIGQSLSSAVSSLVSSVVQIVLVLVFMFVVSWQMALTTIGTLPLNMLIIFVLVGMSQKYFFRQQKSLGAVNGIIEETFSGQLIVKLFNAEKGMENRFDEQNGSLQKATYKSGVLGGFMYPLMGFVSKLGYVAVCVAGGALYANGMTDMGSLAAFLLFVNLFQQPVSQLSQIVNTMQSGVAAAERVFEFLDEPEEENENHKTEYLLPENVSGNVSFEHVRFGYDKDKIIINDFTQKIEPGQKVAIVGPTGAGKTTLVNLLMRFYELNGGEIAIEGKPISTLRRENVRQLFSMVLQDTWLFEGSVRENLCYNNRNITDEQLDEVAKAANVYHFIKSLPNGYDTVFSDDINISGGQKQLLTIARAMLEDAPILILDEATSNVDTRTELLIQEAMNNLSKGKTSFVIAHRLSTIKNADLILVLKDGDVIEKGTHSELLSENGFYASLYNSQFSLSDAA